MPKNFSVETTITRNGQTLSGPAGFAQLQEDISKFKRLAVTELAKEFVRVVIPEARRTLPSDTGALRRSMKGRQIFNGVQVRFLFYGSFTNPDVPTALRAAFKRRQDIVKRAVDTAAYKAGFR